MRRTSALALALLVGASAALAGCDNGAASGPGTTAGATTTSAGGPGTTTTGTSTTTTASGATTTTGGATTTTTACEGSLAGWSLARLAAETVVVPADETDVASAGPEVAAGAGGVILFGASAPADLRAELAGLERSAPATGGVPFVMTDEEGGLVQRMANLVGDIPSARQMGATDTPAQIRQIAYHLAVAMRANGVTMDLAPVLDIDGGDGPSDSDPDGTRSFSPVEATAAAAGVAFMEGLRQGGVVPVVKHFPGLGSATGNTDVEPASTLPWSDLQTGGLVPFSNAVSGGAPAVMISNATVPGLTSLPAGLSPEVVTGILRERLGFQGLVMTDSLSAVAVSSAGYTVPQAAVAALGAGADMFLYNEGSTPADTEATFNSTVSAIVSAVEGGSVTRSRLENAVSHILALEPGGAC